MSYLFGASGPAAYIHAEWKCILSRCRPRSWPFDLVSANCLI